MTVEERRRYRKLTVAQRIALLTDDSAGPAACWPWLGYTDSNGYSCISNRRVGHFVLAIAGQPRPAGLIMLHLCDHPWCVNPAHLQWGTQADNMRHMREAGRWRNNVLTPADVADIRRQLSLGVKSPGLAQQYNVTASRIRQIGKQPAGAADQLSIVF